MFGLYEEHVLPRLINRVLDDGECRALRRQTVQGLSGTVLELGFGSGLNLPHLPPSVERVLAVEPAALGWKLARDRVNRAPCEVERVGLDGQSLPVADASVDHVLSTWTLCTIPDVARALSEVRRVLRPGGHFHFMEHGRSHEPNVARWQQRLTPLQKRVGGGCHLNRDIAAMLQHAGFRFEVMDTFYMRKTPRPFGFLYRGIATA